MEKNDLISIFGSGLSAHGLKRKSSTWYRRADKALQIVNLQRSQFGAVYYINIACVPDGVEVDGMPQPKHYKCPIQVRLTSAFPDRSTEISNTFDLDFYMLDFDRTEKIKRIVSDLLEYIAQFESIESIRDGMRKNRLSGVMISAKLKERMETAT